jgi:hypothetical protein
MELVIWSKFGLYRHTSKEEIATGGVVDKSPAEVEADLARDGYSLTFIDVERVAIMPYPEDKEPDAVLIWLQGYDDEKAALAKEYVDLIGYDPFEDDPSNTVEGVRQIIKEYKEIDAAGGLDGKDG